MHCEEIQKSRMRPQKIIEAYNIVLSTYFNKKNIDNVKYNII
jgi:hypothetical protein